MKYIKINPADNVAVAIEPLQKDEQVVIDGRTICLADDVPAGHKFLLNDLAQGENVVKYGYPIGHITEDHHAGECINHTHIKTNLGGLLDYTYDPIQIAEDEFASRPQEHFMGYRRKNGDVGIRNEIWIVPTVGCVNGVCQQLRPIKHIGTWLVLCRARRRASRHIGTELRSQSLRSALQPCKHRPNHRYCRTRRIFAEYNIRRAQGSVVRL